MPGQVKKSISNLAHTAKLIPKVPIIPPSSPKWQGKGLCLKYCTEAPDDTRKGCPQGADCKHAHIDLSDPPDVQPPIAFFRQAQAFVQLDAIKAQYRPTKAFVTYLADH